MLFCNERPESHYKKIPNSRIKLADQDFLKRDNVMVNLPRTTRLTPKSSISSSHFFLRSIQCYYINPNLSPMTNKQSWASRFWKHLILMVSHLSIKVVGQRRLIYLVWFPQIMPHLTVRAELAYHGFTDRLFDNSIIISLPPLKCIIDLN